MYRVYLSVDKKKQLCPCFRFQTLEETMAFAKLALEQNFNIVIEPPNIMPF